MDLVLAIALGAAFGFALDRVGATNPEYIIRMLNLTNLNLMKTILAAIGIASIFTFGGILAGFVDPGHLSVKTAYVGVFVGGLLLGLGFAIAGYCPGTGLTAFATGRIDAAFFVLGGLVGAGAYMASYASVAGTGILDKVAGGKTTLGVVGGTKYSAFFDSVPGEWLGIGIGAAFLLIAALLPSGSASQQAQAAPAE